MFQFAERVFISRSLDDVFSLLTSFEDIPRYVPEVRAAEHTSPGPPGTGSIFVQHLRFLGLRRDIPTLVTDWEPPVRFAYRSTRPPVYESRYHLTSEGSRTLLEASVTVEPTGWWRLTEPIVRWRMPTIYQTNLMRLKALLEGPP